MASLDTHSTLPASSQEAIQIFDERFLAAQLLQQPPLWAETLGEISDTPSTSVHYPMSVLSLKYEETVDSAGRFKTIGEKDVELLVVEHDDGIEISLMKLLTNTFSAKRWADAPARMMLAESVFRCRKVAALLESNLACGWDDLTLFNDAHFANGKNASKGPFDTLQSSTKDVLDLALLEAEVVAMMSVLDENGDKLGVMPDVIGVPTAKYHPLVNKLKQDIIANAAGAVSVRNPYSDGVLSVVHLPELTDPNDFYLFDTKLIARDVKPWIGAKLNLAAPGFDALGLRRFDENSDHFKKSGMIAVSSHIWYGFKPLYPHAIRKVLGA
jgi:hypothetical protein